MFLDEFTPVFKELTQHPVAFLGGFVSGVLKINLSDDPVKSWLDQQTGTSGYTPHINNQPSQPSGPQTISIE
jgi:hypothetical protein